MTTTYIARAGFVRKKLMLHFLKYHGNGTEENIHVVTWEYLKRASRDNSCVLASYAYYFFGECVAISFFTREHLRVLYIYMRDIYYYE